jgi:transcriptional regulator with XRE-family HTH domain
MSERNAFGPNLRRLRIQRGITLEQLAAATKVSVTLWAGLERNDFSRWPSGIYARSYVRDYAAAIGADPEAAVDDFCRWFPQGDRRAEPIIRGQAQIVGHDTLDWQDHVPPVVAAAGDRRGAAAAAAAPKPPPSRMASAVAAFMQMFMRLRERRGRA